GICLVGVAGRLLGHPLADGVRDASVRDVDIEIYRHGIKPSRSRHAPKCHQLREEAQGRSAGGMPLPEATGVLRPVAVPTSGLGAVAGELTSMDTRAKPSSVLATWARISARTTWLPESTRSSLLLSKVLTVSSRCLRASSSSLRAFSASARWAAGRSWLVSFCRRLSALSILSWMS